MRSEKQTITEKASWVRKRKDLRRFKSELPSSSKRAPCLRRYHRAIFAIFRTNCSVSATWRRSAPSFSVRGLFFFSFAFRRFLIAVSFALVSAESRSVAHKDHRLPAFPQAANECGFAGCTPVRAGFSRVRKRWLQPAAIHL